MEQGGLPQWRKERQLPCAADPTPGSLSRRKKNWAALGGHPWTNGQGDRLHCTLKAATVQRFHYQPTAELNEHLQAFLLAYSHARRLKTLRGLTLPEVAGAQWQKNPTSFTRDPTRLTLKLYS